jgi:molybdate transport system substrate-binding protein
VLIGAAGSASVEIGPDYDLQAELGRGFLAMALVEAVPAGLYGKAALQGLGLWESVMPQVAQTDNVRAALALVATGAAPMGIVYRSDAQAEPRVDVVAMFPAEVHPKIIYPAALTHFAGKDARAFASFLQPDRARVEFLRQGFSLPGS